jgi:hypothetical protein
MASHTDVAKQKKKNGYESKQYAVPNTRKENVLVRLGKESPRQMAVRDDIKQSFSNAGNQMGKGISKLAKQYENAFRKNRVTKK